MTKKNVDQLLPPFTPLKNIHTLTRLYFQMRGYEWQEIPWNQDKIGIWKKQLRSPKQSSEQENQQVPKRFVVIPGFGDTPLSWYTVLFFLYPSLRKNFDELILFDFPGFGGFLANEPAFSSMDALTTCVNHVLDSLQAHTILGHSLGAWLAALYSSQCGPLSSKKIPPPTQVILSNPSGIFDSDKTKQEWANIFYDAMKIGFPALRPHLFKKEPKWFPWIAPEFSQFLNRQDVHQFMSSIREDHLVGKLAAQISSNVLLIWGKYDTLIPVSCAETWMKALENVADSQLDILNESAHSPHLEQPWEVSQVIQKYMMKA